MEDAEAQLYRRIQELRARARGLAEEAQPASGEERPDEPQPAGDALSQAAEARPAMPDLRTILARAESHVEQLRSTAATLEGGCRPTLSGRSSGRWPSIRRAPR